MATHSASSHPASSHRAYRLGRATMRGWRGYRQGERRLMQRLVRRGWPAAAAQALAWAARLAVLCVLLYTAFWVAVVLFVAVAVLWMADHADPRDWEPVEVEWRDGHSGWGLYDKTEWRHDPGSPDDLV